MAKVTRKELLNAPDEFVTTTSSTIKWIQDNPGRFAVIAAVTVAIIGGGLGFYHWRSVREHDAMTAYGNAANSSQLTLNVIQNYADTRAGKLSRLRLAQMAYNEKNAKMAVDYAQEFINSWGQEDTLHWQGILIMSGAYLIQKQYDKAEPLLADCIKKAPENFKDQALFYQAQAYMAQGKKEEAKKSLGQISSGYSDVSTSAMASLETHRGEPVDAKQ
jgi:tetratricopeptide (TPR) repeat protein